MEGRITGYQSVLFVAELDDVASCRGRLGGLPPRAGGSVVLHLPARVAVALESVSGEARTRPAGIR